MMITITGGNIVFDVQEYLNEASIPDFSYAINVGSLDAPECIAAGSTKENGTTFVVRDNL